jgi:hypothetical protein
LLLIHLPNAEINLRDIEPQRHIAGTQKFPGSTPISTAQIDLWSTNVQVHAAVCTPCPVVVACVPDLHRRCNLVTNDLQASVKLPVRRTVVTYISYRSTIDMLQIVGIGFQIKVEQRRRVVFKAERFADYFGIERRTKV